jgi:hypothetical protein
MPMAWFWWLLVMLVAVLWVVSLFDIFRNWGSRSVGKSIAWLIAILVFPVLGTIVYFIVQNSSGTTSAPRDPVKGL